MAPRSEARIQQSPSVRSWYAVTLGISFLAITWILWPALADPTRLVPSYYPDVFEFVWNVWCLGHSERSVDFYSTRLTFHPNGASLLLHTLTEGILLPLSALHLQPVLALNIAFAACLLLNAAGASFLFRQLRSPLIIGTGLTAALAIHPFFIAHLQAGHLNFVAVFPLLFLFGLFAKVLAQKSASIFDCAMAASLSAWLVFINLYYLYFLAIIDCVIVLGRIVTKRTVRSPEQILCYASLAGVAACSPHLLAVLELAGSRTYSPNHNAALNGADVLNFFVPSGFQLAGHWSFLESLRSGIPAAPVEAAVYLTWSLTALTIVAISRGAANGKVFGLLSVAAFFALVGLGPRPSIAGPLTVSNVFYSWPAQLLPSFPSVPARFGLLSVLFVFLAAAVASAGFGRIAQVVCALLLIGEVWPAPLRTIAIESTPALEYLRNEPAGVVVDGEGVSNVTLAPQVFHEKPIVGGFLSRRPRVIERVYRRNDFLQYLVAAKETEIEAIKQGVTDLAARYVLVKKAVPGQLNRMNALPFFERAAEDDLFAVYRRKVQ